MRKLKEIWLGQDVINRIILVSGILACIWCLVKGQGLYGVALVVLMGMLMVSRKSNREKRLGRLYGGLYFHMPDGELVPLSFDHVKAEYTHGQQGKYAGRTVTLRFPWWHLNLDGHGDTGFGLLIHFDGNEEATAKDEDLLTTLEVVYEFYLRGFEFAPISIYDSHATKFLIKDGKLLPPFVAISGLGESAAWDLMEGRKGKTFLSIEEVAAACPKVSKTHMQMLKEAGAFGDLPDTSQVSFF